MVPLLGIYPKELKSRYSGDICILVFVIAFFTNAKLWTQPSCPTTDEWVKKMWYIYTIEFYSAIKNNDNL
jgi:hypothetical protein